MIATTLTALFVVTTFAVMLSLADSLVRGGTAFSALKRERALARAGFVPIVEAEELRLRHALHNRPAATRSFARRLPSRSRAAA